MTKAMWRFNDLVVRGRNSQYQQQMFEV